MSRLMRPLAVLMLITAALQAQQASAPYEEQYQKGRQLLARREYFDALKAFQRANQLAGGKSAEAFVGMAQAMMGMKVYKNEMRDDEGIVELRKEIELRPHNTTAEDAQALIANPRRAREKYAPEFSITTAAHEQLSLDTLRGKVALLDFWASWCAPCAKALPSVRRLQKDHASDPFVVVGISGDREERAWREFVGKNGMIWPQYFDRDHRMQSVFGVTAFPTYVLIDREGIERLRVTGAGFHEARSQPLLRRRIFRPSRIASQTFPSSPAGPGLAHFRSNLLSPSGKVSGAVAIVPPGEPYGRSVVAYRIEHPRSRPAAARP